MLYMGIILKILWFMFIYIVIPILVLIIIYFLIKFTIDYCKYGSKMLNNFKIKDISNARNELLYISLNKISWYKKIIKVPYLKSDYILIDGNGISLFKVFTDVGFFDGRHESKYIYSHNNNIKYKKNNPLSILNVDELIIKKRLANVDIHKYLVVTESTHMNINSNVEIIIFEKIPYSFSNKNKYNQQQIDEFEKTMSKSV